jgi:hypothetical protein
MILLLQSYSTGNEARDAEIARCGKENEESGVFDRIATVDGDKERWTLGGLMDVCHKAFPGEVCVVANSDIIFDASCGQAASLLEKCSLLALTRWESPKTPRMLGHYENETFFSGTQDSWFFVGDSIPSIDIEIPMGHVGCDNVLVGWAVSNGVRIADPALSLKTFHVHADESRPERPSVFGYYGYPELTTSELSPYVLCHQCEEKGFKHLCKFN